MIQYSSSPILKSESVIQMKEGGESDRKSPQSHVPLRKILRELEGFASASTHLACSHILVPNFLVFS